MAAERAVDEARNKLVAELEAVSDTGREALERVVHEARPLVIATAAIAGIALVGGSVALMRRSFSRRAPHYLAAPKQRSLFGQMARQALTSFAGTVAAVLARRVLVSLGEPEMVPAEPHANGQTPRKSRARSDGAKSADR